MSIRGHFRLSDRSRGIASASFGALILKAVSTVSTFVTVPLALRHLGDERYGVWMSINVVLALASFADLGLGNSLVNEIVSARAVGDNRAIAIVVGNVFSGLVVVSTFLIVLMGILVPLVPWTSILHLHSKQAIAEVVPATLIFFVGILLPIAPSVVAQIQIAYEEGFRAAMWSAGSALSQLLGIIVATKFTHGLPLLLLGYTLGPVLLMVLSLTIELGIRRPNIRPCIQDVSLPSIVKLVRKGKLFFLLQICQTITLYSDYAVVGSVLGAQANTTYGVVYRIFSAAMLSAYITRGLWPAFETALLLGDLSWARRTFRRLVFLNTAYGIVAGFTGVLLAPAVIIFWLKAHFAISAGFVEAFGVWLFIMNFVEFLTAISMGPLLLRDQVRFYVYATLGTVLTRIAFTSQFGLAGVVWGCTVPFLLFFVVPMSSRVWHRLSLDSE